MLFNSQDSGRRIGAQDGVPASEIGNSRLRALFRNVMLDQEGAEASEVAEVAAGPEKRSLEPADATEEFVVFSEEDDIDA